MVFVCVPASYTDDDAPYTTDIQLEEGAAGKIDVDAILVMDGIEDAWVSQCHVFRRRLLLNYSAEYHSVERSYGKSQQWDAEGKLISNGVIF